jgi:hypothetical protein
MSTALGFEVSQVKALQKDEGNEQSQDKIQDGGVKGKGDALK